jgi:hypothetical protein
MGPGLGPYPFMRPVKRCGITTIAIGTAFRYVRG